MTKEDAIERARSFYVSPDNSSSINYGTFMGYRAVEELIEEIYDYHKDEETLKVIKENQFKEKFKFTSCDDCIHKTEVYSLTCGECKHFYGCLFEKKESK